MTSQTYQWLAMGAIMALVSVLAGYSVLSARASLRDVTRLAHVRDLGVGLELYFRDRGVYPAAGPEQSALPLGTPATACLQKEGFTATCPTDAPAYLQSITTPPARGLEELSSCGGAANAYCYMTDGQTFTVQFELEHAFADLGLRQGLNCLAGNTLRAGACPAIK